MCSSDLHLLLCLLGCQIPARFLVYLIGKLRAELYHLAHVKVLGEFPLLVAIDAVVLIRITIGIRPFVGIIKRHTATLTKFLYHVSLLFFACQSAILKLTIYLQEGIKHEHTSD